MRTFLSDLLFGRRSAWVAALTVVLCLLISACGTTQTAGQSAGPTATPTSASHSRLPCGASCGGSGGGGGVNTPAPTPAKLSASPTTVTSWHTCAINTSCPTSEIGKLISSVTLSNDGSSSLSWTIGQTTSGIGANGVQITPTSGTIAPGGQAILTLVAPPAFLQALQDGKLTHQWFDVVGPVNTVQINLE